MYKVLLLFLTLFMAWPCHAQHHTADSLKRKAKRLKFNYRPLVAPAALIGYGFAGMKSHWEQRLNLALREEVLEHIDKRVSIDDFSQYAPALAVYGLNIAGIKGQHRFVDRSLILGTSYLIMSTAVTGLKYTTKVERPDSSAFNSFPSGHTATAFACAEFLWQEYKEKSVWYGISGYLVASGTGIFRIYNNRHWLTDVAVGAGIGILSTKISYWIYPWLRNRVFKSKKSKISALAMPFYNGRQFGVGMTMQLK